MGCVWQSDYAPDPGTDHASVLYRPPPRHRKPPVWRRAARGLVTFLTGTVPRPALAAAEAPRIPDPRVAALPSPR